MKSQYKGNKWRTGQSLWAPVHHNWPAGADRMSFPQAAKAGQRTARQGTAYCQVGNGAGGPRVWRNQGKDGKSGEMDGERGTAGEEGNGKDELIKSRESREQGNDGSTSSKRVTYGSRRGQCQ